MLNGFEELRAQEGLESYEGEIDEDEDQGQNEDADIMDEEQLDEVEVARVLSEMTSKGAVNLLSREKYGSTQAGRQKQRPMKGSFQARGGETLFNFDSRIKGLDRQAACAGCAWCRRRRAIWLMMTTAIRRRKKLDEYLFSLLSLS
jgi:hypothetical protein